MSKKLALFIDCDRLEAAFMTVIFDYLRNEDYDVCVKRAYVTKDNFDSEYYTEIFAERSGAGSV